MQPAHARDPARESQPQLEELLLRVRLGHAWDRMFAQLPLLGEVLVMTRNPVAILTRQMRYPEIAITADGSKMASGEAGLWIDFRHFSGAHALHQRRDGGHILGVEFYDATANAAHRFTLTPESELDEFLGWVRLHQACSALPAPWSRPGETGPTLAGDGRTYAPSFLASMLSECLEHAAPVTVTVCGDGLRQRVEFTPHSLEFSDGWWFASDEAVGVHYHVEATPGVRLRKCAGEKGELRYVLSALRDDGSDALLVETRAPAAGVWTHLLSGLV